MKLTAGKPTDEKLANGELNVVYTPDGYRNHSMPIRMQATSMNSVDAMSITV